MKKDLRKILRILLRAQLQKGLILPNIKGTPKNFFAPFTLSRRRILTCKGCGGLRECGYYVISEIFKIHHNRTAGNCPCAEFIYRRLNKDVGKAEHGALNGGGYACLYSRP